MKILGTLALALILVACGGGSSSSSSGGSTGTSTGTGGSSGGNNNPSPPLTDQERTQAADSTVSSDPACTSLTPFYWEIGDKGGALASGTGGDKSSAPPSSTSLMAIASASKWVFSSYALETLDVSASNPLTATQAQYLNFTSGYVNMTDASCFATDSVGGCFSASNLLGGTNGDQTTADEGHFYYNGGHMQAMAMNVFSLSGDYINGSGKTPLLNTVIMAGIGNGVNLYYANPSLAGGIATTAGDYASFLRAILAGSLRMKAYLSADVVCAHANSSDCPTAIYSPINQSAPGMSNNVSDEAWHYSLGHWIEDDPKVGDGAFSSPGADGFYPWIDSTATYYGLLARYDNDSSAPPGQEPYVLSVYCGRAIRKAWLTGVAQ
ncbi:MAG TPA: hypothetical protein VFK21_00700 [Gammaproteobacteria bacterium]|nr:hypothetical protein [Gammaproteobacteria bacterium]